MSSTPSQPQPPPINSSVAVASGRSVAALVVGLLGLVTCAFASPVAWYLGSTELQAIRAGASPPAGADYAQAGRVLGIIGTCLLALGLLIAFACLAVVAVTVLAAAASGG